MSHNITATPGLLTVMAGFFRGPSIPESTRSVEALQVVMTSCCCVDNLALQAIPSSSNTQHCQALFEHHGEYDWLYKRGLLRAEQLNQLENATHVLFCTTASTARSPIWPGDRADARTQR